MDDAHASIFADAASLDEYCRGIRARLEQHAHEQSGRLASRLESLEALLRTARAVGDRELAAELTSHVERARARQAEVGQVLAADDAAPPMPRPEVQVPPVAAPVDTLALSAAEPVESTPVTADDESAAQVPPSAESQLAESEAPVAVVEPRAAEAEPVIADAESASTPEPAAASALPIANEPEAATSAPPAESAAMWASPAPAPAPPWAPLPPAAMAPPPAWQAGVVASAAPAAAPNPDMPWLPASPVIAEPAPAQSIEDTAWAELAAHVASDRAVTPSGSSPSYAPAPAWAAAEPERAAATPLAPPPPNWDTNFAVPASATDPEMGGLCLEVSVGERAWTWRMLGDSAVIGRATPGTSIMPDLDLWPDQTVSRRHLEVVEREGRFYVTDQASANGSLLNDAPLPPNVETEIRAGDQLRLGAASYLKVAGS